MIQAFAYHRKVAAHLKENGELWHFFEAPVQQEQDFQQFRSELLKNTYRLGAEAEPGLYAAVEMAKAVLGITHHITVYQLLQATELNALIYMLPTEAHIVLSGPVLKLMNEEELLAVMAHELGHIRLFTEDGGAYGISHRIIDALCNDIQAPEAYYETGRLFDLYTELYCDNMALQVLGRSTPVISSLVKINTGLERVSADAYIKQAKEIFEKEKIITENISHPENFIRAYALHLYEMAPAAFEAAVQPVIEGGRQLRQLDIFSKKEVEDKTAALITALLAGAGLQTEGLQTLARQYFPAFTPNSDKGLPAKDWLATYDSGTKEYLAYVLTDFVLADKNTEAEGGRRALQLAREWGLEESLKTVLKKELKLSEKKYNERFTQKQTVHE